MGILKHLNLKAASRTLKAAQKDVERPKAKVVKLSDHKQNKGKK